MEAQAAIPDWFRTAHARLTAVHARGGREDPANPETVRAMQIALRIPKDPPPGRTALLEAAATAVVALCLDERAGAGGDFADALDGWYGARIRKIARRARAGRWDRLAALPGVTAEVDGAAARAFPPTPVGQVHPDIARLQIGGTEVPADDPGPPRASAPVVYIDAGLGMTVGKDAAQVGHAAMLLAAAMDVAEAWGWAAAGFPLSVRELPAGEFRRRAARAAVTVADAGFTEVRPGAVTVCADRAP
ncbi:hypothetical protein CSPHI_02940 [Corynebacterium sphenisci DSM 44792]|uniref:Uncharacterized protein n=1 Tax=Corynebacterium sphenisci DSM 44792 TaxID=1437874 RepID=A0A1L7CWF2_9CORY|nr:hypothetical protein [Corynebacterium sphenisci]APT90199.1 hypothetical protein CSPHI_02940 [Corynebacterium sphenisci DSM 44792]